MPDGQERDEEAFSLQLPGLWFSFENFSKQLSFVLLLIIFNDIKKVCVSFLISEHPMDISNKVF